MDYTELKIAVETDEQAEIVTAYLSDYPFDSFELSDGELLAYIPTAQLADCRAEVELLLDEQNAMLRSVSEIATQNWNAVWESDFEEVEVAGKVLIRAPFHAPREGYEGMEVVVQPKMSFGTGHHVTTRMMVEMLLGMDVAGQRLLDMGSGTGVLAIVAAKMGATVMAVEIDDMAEESVRENVVYNGVEAAVESVCGDASAIAGRRFDAVLANINRNILLQDMAAYVATLQGGGRLIMSGFFVEDRAVVAEAARALGLADGRVIEHDGWCAAEFVMA